MTTAQEAADAIKARRKAGEMLTLHELETLAWEFRSLGVSILAAGDEWLLTVPINGVQTTFRALRVGGAA